MKFASHIPRARGFTIVEMLVVILIIGILTSILVVGYDSVIKKAKINKAMAGAQQLAQAWMNYLLDNTVLPSPADWSKYNSQHGISVKSEGGWYYTDAQFTAYLNGHPILNRLARHHIKYDVSSKDIEEGLKDPWGNYYRFNYDSYWEDADVSGEVMHPNGNKVKGTVAVWSLGPDKTEGHNGVFPDPTTGAKPADDIIIIY